VEATAQVVESQALLFAAIMCRGVTVAQMEQVVLSSGAEIGHRLGQFLSDIRRMSDLGQEMMDMALNTEDRGELEALIAMAGGEMV
jgi:hypothetical protein